MEKVQITFSYNIGIFFRKVKCGFASIVLLPLKKCLAHLTTRQIDSFQSPFPDQTGENTPHSCTTDTQTPALNSTLFSPEEEVLETFFSNLQPKEVQEELYRWFYFGLSEKGSHLAELTPEQIEYLKRELPQLISALYNYHRSRRKEACNGA